MDFGSCSVSGSCSSSSRTLSEASDRMVKIEIEAAEVLASMAHFAIRCESGRGWGNKGKRARKLVKDPSVVDDSVLNPVDKMPRCSDLTENQVTLDKKCQKVKKNTITKPVKAQQDVEIHISIPSCSKSYSSVGGSRSRHNLTEAEKEEQRLRRVLANRESARQTILRRQALCEDLTRKAANLAWENENLKKEKELALKQYQSLETTNKHLKSQIEKAIKAEAHEATGELKLAHVEIPTQTKDCPLLLYNHPPFPPMFWPAILQSPDTVQSQQGHQESIAFLPDSLLPSPCKSESYDKQENLTNINGSRSPLYMLPCPWFIPVPNRNGIKPHLSLGLNYNPDENFVDNDHGACSTSKTVAHLDNHSIFSHIGVKTEASGSKEAKPRNDLHEKPVGVLACGDGVQKGWKSKEIFKHARVSSAGLPFAVKHENGFNSDYTSRHEASSSTTGQIRNVLPERSREQACYPHKKVADAFAAAEARKRRKEITKLKNIHGRKCQMQC